MNDRIKNVLIAIEDDTLELYWKNRANWLWNHQHPRYETIENRVHRVQLMIRNGTYKVKLK